MAPIVDWGRDKEEKQKEFLSGDATYWRQREAETEKGKAFQKEAMNHLPETIEPPPFMRGYDYTKLRLGEGYPQPGRNHKMSRAAVSADNQPFMETPLMDGQTTTSGFGAYSAAMEGKFNTDLRGYI